MFKKLDKVRVNKFIEYCSSKPVLFDGAMGTQIQGKNPSPELFCGHDGFNEYLNITAPQIIEQIHIEYLKSGANAIETNTFGANAIVMAEYGMGGRDKVYDISKKAAEIAKGAILKFKQGHADMAADREFFAAGSIGPSTKLPSLGHISFDEMAEAYRPQVEGMIDGGADILVVETCQDILQVKCLLYVISEVFLKKGFMIPVMVSITLQQNGTMLVGTDVSALTAILNDYEIVTSIGFNCALGPFELEKHLEVLAKSTKKLVSAMPNAGLPENIDGKLAYRLTPKDFAGFIKKFVENYGVNIVGGCCGTSPAHIWQAHEYIKNSKVLKRVPVDNAQVSSVYSAWDLKQEPRPFIIGERTNANGSKAFRELLLGDDYDGMLAVAKNQQNGGAHAIDLCVAYVGRDEKKDMCEAAKRFATAVNLPLVIDSTDPGVIETALKLHGGKCIINSINLEDGGKKLSEVVPLAKKLNAAVIALTIDETGMAKSAGDKVKVAKRLYDICVNEYSLPPENIIFDALTFTIGSGDETLRDSAIQTIEAIREIKKLMPRCYTSLGISNVSFGLKPKVRAVVNSVFLKHCIEAGLDMAIINPAGFLPFHKITGEDLEMTENLLFNRKNGGNDPLLDLLKYFEKKSDDLSGREIENGPKKILTAEEKLMNMVIDGEKKGMEEVLTAVLEKLSPLKIVNGPLINAMKKVGELFGAGTMQLPFVLQSAESMKTAVSFLETKMEKAGYAKLGKMVLATVSGDVHDIGKNLVDIILTNNGFEVYNIGIKVPVEEMIAACEKYKANVIGMSGLLVRSTQIMRENLLELERRGLKYDVILGGAALTRNYVENDLSKIYSGRVFYAEDAFSGLNLMKSIVAGANNSELSGRTSNAKPVNALNAANLNADVKTEIKICDNIPAAPFLGRKIAFNIDPAEIYPYLNKTTLFRGQWQYKRGNNSKQDYDNLIKNTVEPLFEILKRKCRDEKIFELNCAYGYYECLRRGNEVLVFDPENNSKVIGKFEFPRQKGDNGLAISDFILPESFSNNNSGKKDIIGMMVVTAGKKVGEKIKTLFSGDNYKDYLHLHGLSVEMAEAFTEYIHLKMRRELGIIENKTLEMQDLVTQGYRGSRYSFGYPACPDLKLQKVMFDILKPGEIGVELTENYEMTPEQSTSSIVIHHPQAKYFAV